MTSKERLFAMLEGKEVDRVPNLNILMMFAAKYINKPYSEFCQDYKVLVEGNVTCNEIFSIDLLSTMSDPYRETYDFGTELEFVYNDLPRCKSHLLKTIEDEKNLTLFDPLKSTRILDRINAIKLYKSNYGDIYPILGWIEGPFAEACDLRGINNAMIDVIEEDEFDDLMMKCVQQGILCAKAQLEAGADIIGIGDAAASIIGLALYEEKVFPYEKILIDEIKKIGGKVKLHICGDISPLLEKITELKVDILDIDYPVDMKKAIELFEGISLINGNINPIDVLSKSATEVECLVKDLIRIANGKACISAGCEIPANTPVENLLAFANALKMS